MDAQRVSGDTEPAWGTLQLWVGGVRISVTKPQHLTAVFGKSNKQPFAALALWEAPASGKS